MVERESLAAETGDIAALVLAAGAATRMGRLKQLLPYGGGTLAGYAAAQAIEAGFSPVVVVTGAQSEAVQEAVSIRPVEFVFNPDWQTGMGSSIAAGVQHLCDRPFVGVAILLADQPLVTANHLRQLVRAFRERCVQAVTAEYHGTVGVPAIFRRDLFPRLLSLPGDAGARYVLRDPQVEISRFSLPEAAVDIDTPADLSAISSQLDHYI